MASDPIAVLRRARLSANCALVMLLTLARAAVAGPRPADALDAGEVRLALAKLHVTASVMYIAAHPDDENTAMLAWFANERCVRTAYLSMTRGDGGQNLLGHELGAGLGVIRTQELLAARRVDGAEQWFTRAVDFGFSKNPEETFAIWGRDSILADVVWAIRRFQPDVIVTRFPTDGSGGHGHHTASALLAEEAFKAAADPRRFPGQLAAGAGPWQARRLFWNAWTPEDGRIDPAWLAVDIGAYNPFLARSYGEIAAQSRSNHKSQGFGVAERHGSLINYLALRAGEPATKDPLEGVELSWARVRGGARVDSLLSLAEREFDPLRPQLLLPRLFEIRAAMDRARSPQPWWPARREQLEALIRTCSGLWVECLATRPTATPGDTLVVVTTVTDRLGVGALVEAVQVGDRTGAIRGVIAAGRSLSDTLLVALAAGTPLTQPYWLRAPAARGLFRVASQGEIGRPDNAPALSGMVRVRVAGGSIECPLAVAYRWADPVQGERWRMLEIAPPASLALDHDVYVFPDPSPRVVTVRVQAQRAHVTGRVTLELPPGWSAAPAGADVQLARAGDETHVRFTVTPGAGPAAASLTAVILISGHRWAQALERIDYPHIPLQTLFPPASARLVRADIRHTGSRAGYVAGSGDAIPDALRQLGYEVTPLSDDEVEQGDLARFETLVTGVRAYNTRPRLRTLEPRLLEWVKNGGTLVMQYNTTADGPLGDLGPYPFQISRDRVTVEEAPISFPNPGHTLLTTPNAIGDADFSGWVQERGLYFASPRDPRYDAPLSSHDPGEPARDGGLLYARYGKGVFIYCAYAMFRQLPAGVPGAWRLFANLVSAR